jgi:hypothetical protein
MTISIDIEKAFDKIQHLLMIKAQIKLGIDGSYLNIIKAICNTLKADIIQNDENLKTFPLKSGMMQEYPVSSLLFNGSA